MVYVLLVRVSFISSALPDGAAVGVDGFEEFLVAEVAVVLAALFLGGAVVPDLGMLFSG